MPILRIRSLLGGQEWSVVTIGITLSPEQIGNAPPEVRRWLERQISASLNLQPEPAAAQQGSEHLIACDLQEAASIFALIRNVLPAVNVLFDLGRGGENVGNGELEAYRLVDMLRHARLKSMEQLAACLQAINEAICPIWTIRTRRFIFSTSGAIA